MCILRRFKLPPIHPNALELLIGTYGPIRGRVFALMMRIKIARSLHRVPQQKMTS